MEQKGEEEGRENTKQMKNPSRFRIQTKRRGKKFEEACAGHKLNHDRISSAAKHAFKLIQFLAKGQGSHRKDNIEPL